MTEELERKRAEFLSRAGEAFDGMFGKDGQNGLVTFAEREGRACEVGDDLTRWLMAEHIALDPTGGPRRRSWSCGSFRRGGGRSSIVGRRRVALAAGRFFSLLDERLALGTEGY